MNDSNRNKLNQLHYAIPGGMRTGLRNGGGTGPAARAVQVLQFGLQVRDPTDRGGSCRQASCGSGSRQDQGAPAAGGWGVRLGCSGP